MAERDVHRVERTEATSVGDQCEVGVETRGKGRDFVQDIVLVVEVAPHAVGGNCPVRIQGLAIDGIHTEKLDLPGFDLVLQSGDKTPVFVVEESSVTGGKYDNPRTGGAENEQFHFTSDVRTIPLMVLAIHIGLRRSRLFEQSFLITGQYFCPQVVPGAAHVNPILDP